MPPHVVPVPVQGVRGVVTATHVPRLDAVTQDSHCPLQAALQQAPSEPHVPLEHWDPAVQLSPFRFAQVPLEHTSVPRVQEVPQQGCPVPPHAVHLLFPPHVMPAPHGVVPPQHSWLFPPQVMQLPPEHTVLAAVHEVPQHAWPAPPHATHMLFVHINPFAQVVPQQGCPAAPHAVHVFAWQIAPLLHVVPQHGWVAAPHGAHVLDAHR